MNSLAESLLKAGLVDQQSFNQVSASKRQKEKSLEGQNTSRLLTDSGRPVSLDRLQSSTSVSEFKDVAKKLLMEWPELINEVIQAAHNFKDKDGGKKLIWLMYQIKDGLATIKLEEREKFLKRSLRRSGGTLEPPGR